MKVCVVALGKIGLPLAVQFASRGMSVVGADISAETVALVNEGKVPFPGEAGLDERLPALVESGAITATTDTAAAVAQSDVVVVVVPLIVDDQARPDFGALDAATRDIARGLKPGTLVSYETTMPLHTTWQRFRPMLEEGSGMVVGEDLMLCHSPERVYSGRIFADLRRYPKLVGANDPKSSARAVEFYEAALEFDDRPDLDRPNGVWDLGSAEAAEFAKLAETTYRDVNIALANEFARYADRIGVDVYQVIAASNSQPFSHIHQPGVAVGGHCIPVYPRLYTSTDDQARVPVLAREVNETMPVYAIDLLEREIGDLDGLTIAVLGAAYRGDVKETAFSGVFPLVTELERRGAKPVVHDTVYGNDELIGMGFTPFALGGAVDGAIVQANHAAYRGLTPASLPGIRALVDGRACVDPLSWGTEIPHVVIGAPKAVLGSATG